MGAITISSSYAAGGSWIGPAVAEKLGFEFYDRAIPVAVAHKLALAAEEVIEYDERPPSRMERLLEALSHSVIPIGPSPAEEALDNPRRIRETTESILRTLADGPGAVVLGRAGMCVLRDRADVLRVRLDGPRAARVELAMERFGLSHERAEAERRETDDARENYAQLFYGVSQNDLSLYHLVIDSTALSQELCTELIVQAGRERLGLDAHP